MATISNNPAVLRQSVAEIVALAEPLLAKAKDDEGAIGNFLAPDKFGPLGRELERIRVLPDTPENRVRARSLLTSLGGVLPDTPENLRPDAGDVVPRNETVGDDVQYYVEHPAEALKVDTGWQDVAGSPGPTQEAYTAVKTAAKKAEQAVEDAADTAKKALSDAAKGAQSAVHDAVLGVLIALGGAAGIALLIALLRRRRK